MIAKFPAPHVAGAGVWGGIVDRWNKQSPQERQARRAVCRKRGHDWRRTSIGRQMCFQCCEWKGEG